MENLTGLVFHRLTVTAFAYRKKVKGGTRIYWQCYCSCGKEAVVEASKLKRGHTNSCGCWQQLRAKQARTVHGDHSRNQSETGVYRSWRAMRERCYRVRGKNYKNYGGRGIKVCARWDEFANFRSDMGSSWSKGMTLERKDVNGDYEPGNCTWIPKSRQSSNTRRCHWLKFDGRTQTLSDWAKEVNLSRSCIHNRLKKGWNVAAALTTPNFRAFLRQI